MSDTKKTPSSIKRAARAVKQARADKQLSLREVAKRSGLTYQSVFRVERGEGSLQTLGVVMKTLNMKRMERASIVADIAVELYA